MCRVRSRKSCSRAFLQLHAPRYRHCRWIAFQWKKMFPSHVSVHVMEAPRCLARKREKSSSYRVASCESEVHDGKATWRWKIVFPLAASRRISRYIAAKNNFEQQLPRWEKVALEDLKKDDPRLILLSLSYTSAITVIVLRLKGSHTISTEVGLLLVTSHLNLSSLTSMKHFNYAPPRPEQKHFSLRHKRERIKFTKSTLKCSGTGELFVFISKLYHWRAQNFFRNAKLFAVIKDRGGTQSVSRGEWLQSSMASFLCLNNSLILALRSFSRKLFHFSR